MLYLEKAGRHYCLMEHQLHQEDSGKLYGMCYEYDNPCYLKFFRGKLVSASPVPRYSQSELYHKIISDFTEPCPVLSRDPVVYQNGVWTEAWVKSSGLPLYDTRKNCGVLKRFDWILCQSFEFPVRRWEDPVGWLRKADGYIPVYDRSWAGIPKWLLIWD